MKKLTLFLAMVLALSPLAFAQDESAPDGATSAVGTEAAKALSASMMGGLGITTIDGKLYYRVQLQPDLGFGKFGVGVDADLLFNDKGIRKEDWNPASRWVRIIRYVRYGQKHDNIYGRVGALDASTLGHGSLMYRYSNRIDDVERKIGLEFDLDFGMFGFESVVSNFGRAEIYGFRGFACPLANSGIPIIKGFEVGGTVVSDVDPDQDKTTKDGVTAFGADLGLPIINTSMLGTRIYYDFGKIKDFGKGNAVGISALVSFPGNAFTLGAKLEQRFLGQRFIPQYFDMFYEVDRYRVMDSIPVRKSYLLNGVTVARNGTYGEISGNVLGKVRIMGSGYKTQGADSSGILHIEATAPDLIPKGDVRAYYDQKKIQSLSDLFAKKENMLMTADIGYQAYWKLWVYLTYQITYEKQEDDSYLTRKKFSTRLALKFNF